ncbi:zinc ABC transporter substrate-binding protein [uncultured Thiothrix sp.]|jgi:zinc transport system substrate-binding protein|uniref:metal ABC transporter solute-binding protein, Zn/Mn family n=1 Tax=uncultured Thiothrix sp. TaxID=223185 RepID=UPI002606462C|nr:zinc ABC transporter substrate-binding protein [uncultured Thiothrix sp.]HMT92107.1 zinc ABC transporter substrate-binding protein [Thiolinea sp.]
MNLVSPLNFKQLITIGWLLTVCGLSPVWATEPLQVFVSVLPQKHFAEKVGGDQVKAEAMVQPGFSPETYEPTAQQISALSKAHLYVRVGMPFEDAWMKRIQGVNPIILLVDARDGVKLRSLEAHSHQGHAEHQGAMFDPHLWVSPRIAKQMAKQMADTFSQLRPEQSALFNKNYANFAAELDQLDQELVELFKDKQNLKFMVFHPAWGYLADAYGLQQIPIEVEGKEPGAKALATLIDEAKHEQVKTIFVQPQFSQRAAEQVAKAIGGQVVSIDNLAEDYIPNLRKTARLIVGAERE